MMGIIPRFMMLMLVCMMTFPSLVAAGSRTVCYFSNRGIYQAASYKVSNLNPSLCTHLVYANTILDNNGGNTIQFYEPCFDLGWSGCTYNGYDSIIALKKQNPNLKVMISMGGWRDWYGASKYSTLVSRRDNIQTFVDSATNFLQSYGFDGMYIDWEFPGNYQYGYTNLITALRSAFGTRYILSAAVAAGNIQVAASYNLPELSNQFDFINLMTYDVSGNWESFNDYGAPLYQRVWDLNNNIDSVVNYYHINNGVLASKLVLGNQIDGNQWIQSRAAVMTLCISTGQMYHYTSLCDTVRNNGWNAVQDPSRRMRSFAYSSPSTNPTQWVGYDDSSMYAVRANYASNRRRRTAPSPVASITTRMTSGGDFICPSPNGLYANPSSCSSYYQCGNGIAYLTQCESDMVFNSNLDICDWPYNVPDCNSG